MAPEDLRRLMQEIQVADYELHAAFRIIADEELGSEHISAFMDASSRRDRMMSRVFSYLAQRHQQRANAAINFANRNGNGRH